MPRTPITTTYTKRTKPSTDYSVNRNNFILQEDFFKILTEDSMPLVLESELRTSYTRRTKPTTVIN